MIKKINILLSVIAILLLLVLTGAIFNKKAGVESVAKGFHDSMYFIDNTDFFPASVKAFENIKPLSSPPRIFIVNQHILAAHLIANQFALSADPKVKTVVLITQNNWNAGQAPIITSEYGWHTPLGDIEPAPLAGKLIEKKLAVEDEDIFSKEHGITGIVPYIAHYFPQANFVPLVIRDKTADETVDALAEELSKLDLSTTVIIASIDMSHYLPKYVAETHDRMTVQTIQSFDYDYLPRLDIDTAPTLRAIMKIAESHKEKNFVQTGGVNSADIVSDPELLSTTSYITGYFEGGGLPKTGSAIHMLFVGDMMFDRAIAKHAEKNGMDSLFLGLERLFLGTHLVIGNLEGTITNNTSVSKTDNSKLQFTFEPRYASFLKKNYFSVLSLANNHALDFGGDGFVQTIQNIRSNGLIPFGSPRNDSNLSALVNVEDKHVCFVGYHDLFVQNDAEVTAEIQRMRPNCDFVVLFAHWGAEYADESISRQRELAHEFVDAGADLVIGAHPHVVEPLEIYKNKAIFYSLGNFIFDQGISFATEHGLAVNVEWNPEKTIFTLIPTEIADYEVKITDAITGAKVLNRLVNTDLLSPDVRSAILSHNQFIIWNH